MDVLPNQGVSLCVVCVCVCEGRVLDWCHCPSAENGTARVFWLISVLNPCIFLVFFVCLICYSCSSTVQNLMLLYTRCDFYQSMEECPSL